MRYLPILFLIHLVLQSANADTLASAVTTTALSGATASADTLGREKQAAGTDTAFFRHLLESGHCKLASLEYERLLHENLIVSPALSCSLGNALLESSDFDKAERIFENVLIQTDNGSELYTTAKTGIVRTYLMQRKPLLALNELDATWASINNDAARFYKSAAYAASYTIDSSKKLLESIPAASPCFSKAKKLDTLLYWYSTSGMKNPINAYLYSSAIPGWGHWYLGDRKKAVKSFLLMAGLSGLICYEGYRFYRGDSQKRYIYGMDIFLVGSLAWNRYYRSIRKASYQQAVEYNQNVQLEFQKRLRGIISE